MRKALVRQSDGYVLNVIEIEEGANWQPPPGSVLVDTVDNGAPGDTWDGKKFIQPTAMLIDWQSQWDAARSEPEKLAVLAKMLGLKV